MEEIGYLYILKDGKVSYSSLTLLKSEIQKIIASRIYNGIVCGVTSVEERDMLNSNSSYFLSSETVYSELIKKGYSVIKVSNLFKIDSDFSNTGRSDVECFISKKINKADRDNINSLLSQIKDDNINEYSLYNYYNGEYGNDFDFNYTKNKGKYEKVLDCFLREKTNELSDEERKMFDKYRNFDLEDLLTESNTKYSVNNANAGVIVISNSNIYKSTVKKQQHGEEVIYIYNYINKEYANELKNKPIEDVVLDSSSVIIQVNLNELIVWMPTIRSEFQNSELQKISEIVSKINSLSDKKVCIYSNVCGNDIEYNTLESFNDLIFNQKKR